MHLRNLITTPPWTQVKTEGHSLTAAILGIVVSAGTTFGGTVITSNLPSDTAIINVNAQADGSALYNADTSLWYHPFSQNGASALLTHSVPAGTYSFRVIDPADAARLFPALTPAQTSQIYTAWTFNTPWVTDYLVFDIAAATNFSLPQLFDGAFSNTNGGLGSWTYYSGPQPAYDAAITKGFYDLLRTSATGGRNSTNAIVSYTFASATTLVFAIPDYALSDNSGGVSVVVSLALSTLPRLSIELASLESVSLKWPTNYDGFGLESNADLLTTNWAAVLPAPVVVGGFNFVTNVMDAQQRFFRLRKP